ncbi:hypothetical protein J5X84_34460 [Streptosporangiaceae bacterium NEAU-GS5]|nr:hypothetical protein [Streptosporangiaceae bacterium NEAU-GS5]
MLSKPENAEFIASARGQLASGVALDDILLAMKETGFTPIDCIRAIIDLTGRPLAEAQATLIHSPAWAHLDT